MDIIKEIAKENELWETAGKHRGWRNKMVKFTWEYTFPVAFFRLNMEIIMESSYSVAQLDFSTLEIQMKTHITSRLHITMFVSVFLCGMEGRLYKTCIVK
jgi:hypothetical protein